MKTLIGSFVIYRTKKAASHPSFAAKPWNPNWTVRFNMPGETRKDKVARYYPVCPDCLACEGDPVKLRPNCACIEDVKKWAKSEQAVMTEALRRGDLKKKEEWLNPKRVARLADVLALYEIRGPDDRKQRLNYLKTIWAQATGRQFESMQWADLNRNLILDWAELRQEAGRRGWLGLGRGKNMPEGGWQKLRDIKAGRIQGERLPALDTRTAQPWNTTILSYLTSVKSIFGETARRNVLRELLLPDLTEFLEFTLDLPTPKGHKAMTRDQLQALLTGADKLRKSDPRLWVVNQLLMRLSCRPAEVEAARPSWLEKLKERTRIVITNRPEEGFMLKAGNDATERRIWLPADLAAAIHEVMTATSIFGARTKTEARDMVYYLHSQWMRKTASLDGTQTNYLLRHMGAAERMTSEGAGAAAALLGHSSEKLVKSTYGANFNTLDPLGDEEILRRFDEG